MSSEAGAINSDIPEESYTTAQSLIEHIRTYYSIIITVRVWSQRRFFAGHSTSHLQISSWNSSFGGPFTVSCTRRATFALVATAGAGRGIAAFVLRPPSLHVLRDRLEACKTRRRVCIKCSVCKCWIVWKERVGDEPDVMTPPLFRDPPLGQRGSESQRLSRPQAQQRRPLGRYYCQF